MSALPNGVWVHLGINFGGAAGLELYVDGVRQTNTGTYRFGFDSIDKPCNTPPITTGLQGNANPWLVGEGGWLSGEGTNSPLSAPFNGAVDELRISSVRRDFTR